MQPLTIIEELIAASVLCRRLGFASDDVTFSHSAAGTIGITATGEDGIERHIIVAHGHVQTPEFDAELAAAVAHWNDGMPDAECDRIYQSSVALKRSLEILRSMEADGFRPRGGWNPAVAPLAMALAGTAPQTARS